jgi:CubicO group peptidase (beta-lactamase class C family)
MAMQLDATRLDAALTPALQGFVARGAYAGFSATVWQGEELVYQRLFGQQDREAATPWREDAIVRIYSMSKPITGAALAVLWDRGLWDIDDPVAKYLPEFGETPVYVSGGPGDYVSAPQAAPMTLRHLFTHTSGLSYGFDERPVDAIYRSSRLADYYEGRWNPDLAEFVAELARQPLMFQPGTAFNYSFATDVLGRVAEVIAGQPFRDLLRETLFGPLEMVDTDFFVSDDRRARFAPCYSPVEGGGLKRLDGEGEARYRPASRMHSGGGGLVSTLADYMRFLRMLLGEGELGGVRVLSPRAVRYLMTDHLPPALFPYEATNPGMGYGLCGAVRVQTDPLIAWDPVGLYSWGGAASTSMWVDPVNRMAGLLMPQLMPADFTAAEVLRRTVYTTAQ